FQLQQLFTKAGVKFVPHAERQRQAVASLQHLGTLSNDVELAKTYDLLRQEKPLVRALLSSPLTVHAAPALSGIATHTAQRALVDVASDTNFDVTDRQAARKAFAAAVARRGLLLTTSEIRQQYDLYNASETLDADTQQLLAGVLDIIEQKKVSSDP
ncbi:MAG TPA: hypothetical protein VL096_02855, partial [Pirellulaceae bacterium]|nr:hypothetical protein [Pirellulaceae bacterium]